MNRTLARRVAAIEEEHKARGSDHARAAMADALERLGISGALETALACLLPRRGTGTLADIHPDLFALYFRLWLERQGWAFYEEDLAL